MLFEHENYIDWENDRREDFGVEKREIHQFNICILFGIQLFNSFSVRSYFYYFTLHFAIHSFKHWMHSTLVFFIHFYFHSLSLCCLCIMHILNTHTHKKRKTAATFLLSCYFLCQWFLPCSLYRTPKTHTLHSSLYLSYWLWILFRSLFFSFLG